MTPIFYYQIVISMIRSNVLQSLEHSSKGVQIFENLRWSYKRLKLKLRVILAGHIVAMVTYCATKLTVTYSPMIGQFFDTLILVSTDIEWL